MVKFVRKGYTEKKYIVRSRFDMGDCTVDIMSAMEIFDMMDMSDCFDIDIDIYEFGETFGDAPMHRLFRGHWSHFDDPLRMEITDEEGNVLAVGHGTDH